MQSVYFVRRAHEADAPQISELILSTSLACCFDSVHPCPAWYASSVASGNILNLLQNDETICILAEWESKIIGFLSIQARSHVKYFFVHQDHHRHGIGKSLWAFALHANALGESISVRSSLFAVPVYECLGFSVSAPQQVFNGICFLEMSADRAVLAGIVGSPSPDYGV